MINTWRKDIDDTEKEFGIPITLTADVKLLPGQYKIDVDLPAPAKEHAHAEQRHQKQPHQKQQPLSAAELPEVALEQPGQETGPQPAAQPEQKRRRKRRPRRGKKGARKEGAVMQTEEAVPEVPLSDPIQEGI